jgi:cyclophilin family peptidyl-prolyl cis-trans isomerase
MYTKFHKMHTLFLVLLPLMSFSCLERNKTNNTVENNIIVRVETIYGNIDIQLYNETPLHRDNFVKLIREGFYDKLLFHRVIENFMIQGGDPGSRNAGPDARLGSGGPGYTITAEINEGLFHKKGAIAAARQGDNVNPEKESSGSQFYIVKGRVYTREQLAQMETQINDQQMHAMMTGIFRKLEREALDNNNQPDYREISEKASAMVDDHFRESGYFAFSDGQYEAYTTLGGTPHLDGAYTVFGETIKGFDVIDKIAAAETGIADRPVSDIVMSIKIVGN